MHMPMYPHPNLRMIKDKIGELRSIGGVQETVSWALVMRMDALKTRGMMGNNPNVLFSFQVVLKQADRFPVQANTRFWGQHPPL